MKEKKEYSKYYKINIIFKRKFNFDSSASIDSKADLNLEIQTCAEFPNDFS